MQPLRIEFSLHGLMSVPERHPILLDGLLAALSLSEQGLSDALPLQRLKTPSGDFYMASAIEVDFLGPGVIRKAYRNSQPLEVFDYSQQVNVTRVNLQRGMTRTVPSCYLVRQAVSARAWCIGDAELIRKLLPQLSNLGAYGHRGMGQVLSAEVHADESAHQNWWRRPTPSNDVGGDPYRQTRVATQGGCEPPYWQRQAQVAWWPEEML